MPSNFFRVSYDTWQEGLRQQSVAFNNHRHVPYSKPGTASADTTLDDDNHTVSLTASGYTVTLPSAVAARVGQDWTVHLGVSGSVTVACGGSDTVCTSSSATDTSIAITVLGDSLTFRCLSAGKWILV